METRSSASCVAAVLQEVLSGDTAKEQIIQVSCQICGDFASGKHYGVMSCEGCKGFFKRSIRMKIAYPECTAGGNCEVSKDSRKFCRSCRFEKCLRLGMNLSLVQYERKPQVVNSTIADEQEMETQEVLDLPVACVLEDNREDIFVGIDPDSVLEIGALYPVPGDVKQEDIEQPSIRRFAQELLRASVKWTTGLHLFQALGPQILKAILKSTWHELFVFGIIQNKVLLPSGNVMHSYYEQLNEEKHEKEFFSGMQTRLGKLDTFMELAIPLELDNFDLAYLKILALMSPMKYQQFGVAVSKSVNSMYNVLMQKIVEHVESRAGRLRGTASLRIARMMDLLSQLKFISGTDIEELYFYRKPEDKVLKKVHMDFLYPEMLITTELFACDVMTKV